MFFTERSAAEFISGDTEGGRPGRQIARHSLSAQAVVHGCPLNRVSHAFGANNREAVVE